MKIALVALVFNEEDAIPIFTKTVREYEAQKTYEGVVVFINDGDKDSTETLINALPLSDPLVIPLTFNRNYDKDPVLLARLDHTTDDAIILIDDNLHERIEIIPHMIKKWQAGAEKVLAKRSDHSTDGRLKRKMAGWFYNLHNKIHNPKLEENVGDFRLMNREFVENIKQMPEHNLFMKGVLSWVGGTTDVVEYARYERVADDTKLNSWELRNLAPEGITSFSPLPLRIWTYIGFVVASVVFCMVPG